MNLLTGLSVLLRTADVDVHVSCELALFQLIQLFMFSSRHLDIHLHRSLMATKDPEILAK